MNYLRAQLLYRLSIAAGALTFSAALISTVFSTLKMLHWRLDNGTAMSETINRPITQFTVWLNSNTRPLDWFWDNSPTPDFIRLSNASHWKYLVIYLLIFLGAALYSWGRTLMVKMEAVEDQMEAQLKLATPDGETAMTREQLEDSTVIDEIPSFFAQVSLLVVKPLTIGLIGVGLLWMLRII
ncbi:MAG: YniB family protein [Candidatus Pseudomonas colombiensis]|jgi:hypothetical protein|nr:MAG: YniB family protein [Pseudomonas sp.]